MRIITRARFAEFSQNHPAAMELLVRWEQAVKRAKWENTAELKATFSSASFVGEFTVFNIGGNKFRLIAFVSYDCQILYIKHILTHKEYDRGGWKK